MSLSHTLYLFMEIKNIEFSWGDILDLSCKMDLWAIGDAYLIVCVAWH